MVSYSDKLGGRDCLQVGIAVHTTSFSTAFIRQLVQARRLRRPRMLRLHLEVGKDMRVRRGFGMLFRNRLFAGAGWLVNAVC